MTTPGTKRIIYNGREVIVRERSQGRYVEKAEYRARRADIAHGMRIAGRADVEIAETLGVPVSLLPRILDQ